MNLKSLPGPSPARTSPSSTSLIHGPPSWGIMEPVTYFFGLSLVIFWWAYFTMASKEFSW